MKILKMSAWMASAVFLALSLASLPSLPSINIDEIGNCAVANYFLLHHRIIYALFNGVVHPSISSLVGLDNLGLRAPYFFVLGWFQNIFGFNYVWARGLGVLVWSLLGLILFFKLRSELDTNSACIGVLVFVTSFDAFLSSHLVRGDIIVALLLMMILASVTGSWEKQSSRAWFWAGIMGSLAFFGVHPNGLLVLISTVFLYVWKFQTLTDKKKKAIHLLTGLALGWLISVTFMDLETYVMAKSSMVQSLYDLRITSWKERLWPWNFLGDVPLFFLRTQSFYLSGRFNQSPLWGTSAVVNFFLTACVLIWARFQKSKPIFVRDAWGLSCLILVGLGFGAAREELIYQVLLTVSMIPVLSWGLVQWQRDLKGGPRHVWWYGAALAGILWVFRTNILFYLCLISVSLVVLNVPDRRVIGAAIMSLVIFLCARIRGKAFFGAIDSLTISQLLKPWSIAIFILSVALVFRVWVKSGRHPVKPPYPRRIAGLIQLTFLVTGLLITRTIALVHIIQMTSPRENLNATFEKAERLAGPSPGRILGPSYFWLWKKDSVFDVGGIIMDRYYSNQIRPRDCIERAHPDVLIVDDDFKRRYLTQYRPEEKRWELRPIETVLPVPASYVGTIPASWHHSQLDFYHLNWGGHSS